MEPTPAGPTESLAEFLHARALASSPRRLILDLVGGAAVAACAVWARPYGWVVLVSASLSFAMFGAWSVAERRLQRAPEEGREITEFLWFFVRTATAGVGLLGVMVSIFALLYLTLGTWIS
jgi:Flp pilus assembly protein TadB